MFLRNIGLLILFATVVAIFHPINNIEVPLNFVIAESALGIGLILYDKELQK